MSKIIFDDKSFIECKKAEHSNKIIIIITAKDYDNPLKMISNAVEITEEQFKKLVSEI
jgi:hypothetical protein